MRLAGYTSVEGTGVPVVNSTAVSIKYLEAMTDIALRTGLVKSTRLDFRAPSHDALDGVRRSLSLR